MKKKSTWRFIWEHPFILIPLFSIWFACLLIIFWFVNASGETEPLWIIMFSTLPIGTMYMSWLIVKIMYNAEEMDL